MTLTLLQIFLANNDTISIVKNQLKNPIIAKRIRIVPQGETFSIYCGRFEIYGCEWKKQKGTANYFQSLKLKFYLHSVRLFTVSVCYF